MFTKSISIFLASILAAVSIATTSAVAEPKLAACEATASNFNAREMQLTHCYEKEVGAAPKMMDFIGFPVNEYNGKSINANAVAMGNQMAATLSTWQANHVEPIVILEPTIIGPKDNTVNMNLNDFTSGSPYYEAMVTFLQTIKDNTTYNITDQEMGIWVPFPEPNLTGWYGNNTSPTLFQRNFSLFASLFNSQFPTASLSVMLNAQTAPDNWSWNPIYLKPYVDGLNSNGYISSFGLQGFTWDNTDLASTFVNNAAAEECATSLGVKQVWFNTGTYSVVNDPNTPAGWGIVKATTGRRSAVLKQILQQAEYVQNDGLTMDFINIFGENNLVQGKAGSGTADFAYTTSPDLNALATFDSNAKNKDIPVAVFNAEGN